MNDRILLEEMRLDPSKYAKTGGGLIIQNQNPSNEGTKGKNREASSNKQFQSPEKHSGRSSLTNSFSQPQNQSFKG